MATKKKQTAPRIAVEQDKGISKTVVVVNAATTQVCLAHIKSAEALTVIDSLEGFEGADSLVRDLRTVKKQINDQRLNATRPIDALKKSIMAAAKELTDPLEAQEKRLGGLILGYQREQERLAEQARQEALRKAQEETVAGASIGGPINDFDDGVCDGELPAPDYTPAPPVVKSTSVTTRMVEILVIDDLTYVPHRITCPGSDGPIDLLAPIETNIKAVLKTGITIPGVRIVKEERQVGRG